MHWQSLNSTWSALRQGRSGKNYLSRTPQRTGPARNKVRKAERAGLTVESDSTGRLVPVYYDLYMDWVRRRAQERGLPTSIMLRRASRMEPLRKFQVVAQKLGSACHIWVARLDGQPVAAVIILIHGTHANYWRSCSNKELAGQVAANNLLTKLTIEYACEAGCLDYNMGWSGTPSLTKYKEQLGCPSAGISRVHIRADSGHPGGRRDLEAPGEYQARSRAPSEAKQGIGCARWMRATPGVLDSHPCGDHIVGGLRSAFADRLDKAPRQIVWV